MTKEISSVLYGLLDKMQDEMVEAASALRGRVVSGKISAEQASVEAEKAYKKIKEDTVNKIIKETTK